MLTWEDHESIETLFFDRSISNFGTLKSIRNKFSSCGIVVDILRSFNALAPGENRTGNMWFQEAYAKHMSKILDLWYLSVSENRLYQIIS